MGKVFITGIGAISSLGLNVQENLAALRAGKTGIGKAKHFQSKYTESLYFAEIDSSDEALKLSCDAIQEKEFTRTTLIALTAFSEAIKDANLTNTEISSPSTAFISSSTVGGMCYTDNLYADANLTGEPSDFVKSYEGSDHTLRIIQKYEIVGYTDTINTACSSSANAIMLGVKLIKSGRAKRVIVGGSDCLAKYTVNGFNSLRILSEQPCKPFDVNRDGLTLGEAAAYLVLEAEELVINKQKYAEVVGYGNANDAFHPSATSDEAVGPVTAMNLALKMANLLPNQIDYINAHGTGTPNNDITESAAFASVFETVPPYNSTKSYTGHTLAASGALETIFCILSMNNSELYASLQCSNPIEEYNFNPISRYQKGVKIQHVMTNSFGFGGNCTSIILSKCL
jgi:3-oxoacyl-(acyl-carrier-protein) synthase